MKPYKTVLVVGKFSPLHLGHELLIQRAMAASDETIIISYSKPELPGCEPSRREQWLRTRFPGATILVLDHSRHPLPDNDADALVHREFVGHLCLDVLGRTVDAVFTSEDYGDGFAAELGRYFTTRLGRPMTVGHVSVDQARLAVPVSGTLIRRDPHAQRAFLSQEVYASFIKTVCFLGGESSGKTTMAETMAHQTASLWAPEYGRELWVTRDGVLAYGDMAHIAAVQQQREDELKPQAHRFLFCDTSPLTTLFYSMEMFGRAEAALQQMANRTYDHTFLCAPDFEFVQDGTRREAEYRHRQHRWYQAELARRNMPHTMLTGPVSQRVATILGTIGA